MFRLLLLSCFLAIVQAQRIAVGRCPDVTLQEGFDASRYVGTWFEIKNYFAIYQEFADCATAEYALLDGGNLSVNNSGSNVFNRETVTSLGTAVQDPVDPAKYVFSTQSSILNFQSNYWIVATDYDNYSIVFSCDNGPLGLFNYQFSWIYSRSPNGFDTKTFLTINRILRENRINRFAYCTTSQKECPGRDTPTK